MKRARRLVLTAAVLALGAGTAVAGWAQPALAEYTQPSPTTWAYTDSHDPTATFIKPTGDMPVGTRLDAANVAHTSRIYFTFDLTRYKGEVIHLAALALLEHTVTDCSAPAPLELWRTRPITDQTSWRHAPAELERLATVDPGQPAGCPGYRTADLIAALNAALARRDTQITFELRVPADQEADPRVSRTFERPGITISANHPPVLSSPGLGVLDPTCGSTRRPTLTNRFAEFSATLSDVDRDFLTGSFAVWPVEHPDQRQEFFGSIYGADLLKADRDLNGCPDGSVLAWQARAYDQQDYSPWSKTCYLVLDLTAPAKEPVVTSSVYLADRVAHGGPGVPGKFRFDPQGDPDVAAFVYGDQSGVSTTVKVRHPGEPVTVSFTPDRAGPFTMSVTPVDAAGNRGPTASYRFTVASTAPNLTVDVGGVNLPSHLGFQSNVTGTTSFGYQIDGGSEVKVPATSGAGGADVTFTHTGVFSVTAKTYVKNKMVGSGTQQVYVDDAPGISSDDFSFDHDGMLDQPGTFTFRPRTTNVVGYLYDFGDGEQRIDAAADGSATLTWTPTTGGYFDLLVRSVQADGSISVTADYQFNVVDPHPSAYSGDLVVSPRIDGVGVPIEVDFSDALYERVTGYVYQLDGGPEQTVAADFGYARTTVTPDRAGSHTIAVTGQLAGGGVTPTTIWTYQITSAPVVSWLEAPGGNGGMTGQPATFSFKPGLPGVAEYHYTLPNDQQGTVAAGADGSATVVYTPTFPSYQTIQVYSLAADGTQSDTRIYPFIVRDPRVMVNGGYDDTTPSGGIGVPRSFGFTTWLAPDVVEFRYQVNGGPTQVVPASVDGVTTYVTITPDRNGPNTLTVLSVTAAGDLSPVTEFHYLVGTAPFVVSAEYPAGNFGGGVGVQGTFGFSGGTDGIVAFDYQFDNGTAGSVDTDSTGAASVTFSPTAPGYQSLTVHGRRADGTTTDPTTYTFIVNY